jgi:hypothetical protein
MGKGRDNSDVGRPFRRGKKRTQRETINGQFRYRETLRRPANYCSSLGWKIEDVMASCRCVPLCASLHCRLKSCRVHPLNFVTVETKVEGRRKESVERSSRVLSLADCAPILDSIVSLPVSWYPGFSETSTADRFGCRRCRTS